MIEEVFKIVLSGTYPYRTLFKAVEGSRFLPYRKWIKADKRMSCDGSGGKPYLTGIHCFRDLEMAKHYLSKFSTPRGRTIIKCLGKNLRQKPTNKNVFLADEIFISSKNGRNRIN